MIPGGKHGEHLAELVRLRRQVGERQRLVEADLQHAWNSGFAEAIRLNGRRPDICPCGFPMADPYHACDLTKTDDEEDPDGA